MKPIAIIDCAMNEPSFQCMNYMNEYFEIPTTYHWVSKHGMSSLLNLKEVSGYIIYGSNSNVEDRLAWQLELSQFMKKEIEKSIPTLGICFGHQLIADAYGSRVDLLNDDGQKAKGIREVEITSNLFGFTKSTKLKIFVTHSYEIKELPDGFIHLASSNECIFDAIAHVKYPYFSFQGHPEASKNFLTQHEISLNPQLEKEGLNGGRIVIENFINLVKNQASNRLS